MNKKLSLTIALGLSLFLVIAFIGALINTVISPVGYIFSFLGGFFGISYLLNRHNS